MMKTVLAVFGALALAALSASATGIHLDDWQWRSPTPQGNDLRFVDRLNGGYFAAGEFSAMVRSGDGTNWFRMETETFPERTDIRGGAYGNGIYVCVGDFNNAGPQSFLATSTNGFDWELPQRIQAYGNSAVTFGNGKFLALVGEERGIHSVDGLTWTAVGLPDVMQLKFLNGRFCAFGQSFSTSSNAVNWEVHTANLPGPYPLEDLAYGNGVWVGTGGGPQGSDYMIVRSTDGTNWTTYVPEPFNPNAVLFVSYGGGLRQFAVCGAGLPFLCEFGFRADSLHVAGRADVDTRRDGVSGAANGHMLGWEPIHSGGRLRRDRAIDRWARVDGIEQRELPKFSEREFREQRIHRRGKRRDNHALARWRGVGASDVAGDRVQRA